MGYIYWYLSQYDPAVEHFQGAAIKYHQAGNTDAEAGVLDKLGEILFWLGDSKTAVQEYKHAFESIQANGQLAKTGGGSDSPGRVWFGSSGQISASKKLMSTLKKHKN